MRYGDLIARHNPSQSHWELNELLVELESFQIAQVLEIGMHQGGSARVWRDVFGDPHLVGVNWTDELVGDRTGINAVFGRSQETITISRVIEELGGPVDFLFIDGGHLYHEVQGDWYNYSPLVRPGGVVAFHDVMIEGNPTCEVNRFWAELQKGHRTKTIWDGGEGAAGNGVGIVYL